MGKSTISMAMFYVANCKRLPEGTIPVVIHSYPILSRNESEAI